MKKISNKVAAMVLTAALGTASLPFATMTAHAASSAISSPLTAQEIQGAVSELARLGVMQGYADRSMGAHNQINRAELAKMVVKTFNLEGKAQTPAKLTDIQPNSWAYKYASELVGLGIMQAEDGQFNPTGTVTDAELVQIVSKALNRDTKSVNYWMERFYSGNQTASRGEVAFLLKTAHKAIPSEKAKITSVQSLNAITLIVTFDAPLTAEDEVFAKAKADFVFNDGLTLTNMPRLKTGSMATYIVPTSVQTAGTTYNLTYKGNKAGTFTGNATKLQMNESRQVTNDTFELESLRSDNVTDYGYVISAYSAGRGENAYVLDQNNRANGTTYQIISSMQARQVTITPAGGEPIVAKYVPFTQSTDGKQEPKFRLPEGQVLTPGVTYTVTSDWATIKNPTFVAEEIAPVEITEAEALSDTSIAITLAEDPGDELFSGRSVELTAENGEKLLATYKYSSRKGAVGIFDLQQNGSLAESTTYTVTPVGEWAGDSQAELTVE
ncbi:S-layer homology domain-containing protein [Brevibacillus choshinensis]|uniref:S-layer homology domain-containing protein n=1 Tax=Brevibacillus choshinensis TaxID=54911 RepID=UPI002E210024|nr:S-layer homology domain-containing protein [Brevibacillus choshinensis]MED4782839.1 S-layer homology domain-containing protein [Brevibacillus choshinensis]